MILKTYASWREEKAAVEQALAALLPTLSHPCLVYALASRLAPAVGLPQKRCATILGWLAREGHPNVTHDGGRIRAYGREGVLWRWHPLPQREPEGLEARLNDAGVVDTKDW